MTDSIRWRRIVKKASDLTSLKALKSWLDRDEKGVWEKEARLLWETPKIQDHRTAQGWSEDQLEESIAGQLALLGLMAMIK